MAADFRDLSNSLLARGCATGFARKFTDMRYIDIVASDISQYCGTPIARLDELQTLQLQLLVEQRTFAFQIRFKKEGSIESIG